MSHYRLAVVLFSILIIGTLLASCINVNIPSQGKEGAMGGQAKPMVGSISKSIKLPIIESFNATPENLLSGGSGTLVWKVNNVDTVMITPDIGKVNASGNKTVKPSAETTYTLVASNRAGTVAKSVTIKILTALQLGSPSSRKQAVARKNS